MVESFKFTIEILLRKFDLPHETGPRCVQHTHTRTSSLYMHSNKWSSWTSVIQFLIWTRKHTTWRPVALAVATTFDIYLSLASFFFFSTIYTLFLLHIVAQGQFICLVLVFLLLHSLCWRATTTHSKRREEREKLDHHFSATVSIMLALCRNLVKIDSSQWYIGWKNFSRPDVDFLLSPGLYRAY